MTATTTDTIRPFTPRPRDFTVVANRGTEFFVTQVNPKTAYVTNVATGERRSGPHAAFTFVRDMTSEDHKTLSAFEAARPKKASTSDFGLGNRVRLKEGTKRFENLPEDQEYVVIGVNAKTLNVVPDGGFPGGSRYLQYGPDFLEIVKAGYK